MLAAQHLRSLLRRAVHPSGEGVKVADRDPISDEDLQRIRLEPLIVHQGTITLVDSDPNWPILFEREARRIQQVLGPAVVQLEHAAVPDGCSGEANLDRLVPRSPTPGAMQYVRT